MNRPRSSTRAAFAPLVIPALAIFALSGCAANSELSREDLLKQTLRARGLDPERIVVPFELSQGMRDWAHEMVPKPLKPDDKLRRLRDALFDRERLQLQYTWGYTGTAIDVFEQQRANCLAFTNLFVGMARELGVEVFFLGVEPPSISARVCSV